MNQLCPAPAARALELPFSWVQARGKMPPSHDGTVRQGPAGTSLPTPGEEDPMNGFIARGRQDRAFDPGQDGPTPSGPRPPLPPAEPFDIGSPSRCASVR